MQFSMLGKLLNSDLLDIVGVLWQVGKQLMPPQGMYEVLNYETRLELLDTKGEQSVFYKRQKVRFLQNNVIAYQDQAWGDGEIFAEYECSPGVPVDRYQEGNRWRVLISLRQTRNRGDVEEFHIKRSIRNGFTGKTENFQNKIDHRTHEASFSVVFPKRRLPHRVVLVEDNQARTVHPNAEQIQALPDGRQQIVWTVKNPRLFELYSIRWEW
jgi:hypothetical protein